MNKFIILHIIGWILNFEAAFMILPLVVSLIYREQSGFAFLISIGLCLLFGIPLSLKKPKSTHFFAKEGFITVALGWIILSLFGALPFFISGEIPSYLDALFETVSGFTTTGSTILSDVEALSNCMLFWRSFSLWIGNGCSCFHPCHPSIGWRRKYPFHACGESRSVCRKTCA